METVFDIQQLLKRFGTFIYTGDRFADLELMEDEIRELYKWQLIEARDYQSAMLILKREKSRRSR